ncbi:MAG: methionyl-tRNA formyltransferase [Lachnospiraceae bacterium]|nr:methionyl-tRNA formyltransferase [Lachnospiraceae bacterium]
MRFVFMGTPDFSVGIMEELISMGHTCLMAVTQPDKPKGRGHEVAFPPVKEAALARNIEVIQPENVSDPECVSKLKSLNAEVFVVAAYGQLLSEEVLAIPRYGCVNVHASLLPRYRGASPIQWAVINGDEVSGVTTMLMSKGLDTGDIIMKKEVALSPDETGGSLFDKLSREGALLAVKTLNAISKGTATYEKQDDSLASYTGKIDKKFGKIDWNKDAASLERLIRGLDPWPGTYTRIADKSLKIWKASVAAGEKGAEPGQVIYKDKKTLKVQCGRDALNILRLQLEGKKAMDTDAFLRGFNVSVGDILR